MALALAAACLAPPAAVRGEDPGGASAAPAAQPALAYTSLEGVRRSLDWGARETGALVVYFCDLRSRDSLFGLQFLDLLARRAADFGLAALGVERTERQPEEVSASLERFARIYPRPAFPLGVDTDGSLGRRFGVSRLPTTLLIDAQGGAPVRFEGFDAAVAVRIARHTETLLRLRAGFLSPVLREAGVKEESQVAAGVGAATPPEETRRVLDRGDRLPPLVYTDVEGSPGRWEWQPEGPVRVVYFWASLAPPDSEGLRFLQELRSGPRGTGIEILAVETGRLRRDTLKERVGTFSRLHFPLDLPLAADPDGGLADIFGVVPPLPRTFLVGPEGEVIARIDGFDAAQGRALEERVDRALRYLGRDLPAARPRDESEAPSISRNDARERAWRDTLSRADFLFSSQNYALALVSYRQCLEMRPDSLHARVRVAQIHDLAGERPLALQAWLAVLQIMPGHAEARERVRGLRAVAP